MRLWTSGPCSCRGLGLERAQHLKRKAVSWLSHCPVYPGASEQPHCLPNGRFLERRLGMALSEDTDDEDCYAHCKRATTEACASASRDGSSCTGSPLGSDCRAAVAAEAMLRWNARPRYLRREGGISNLGPRPTFRAQGSPPQDQCERTCSQTCLMPCHSKRKSKMTLSSGALFYTNVVKQEWNRRAS